MSVLIKGMKMPREGLSVVVNVCSNRKAYVYSNNDSSVYDVIELSEHGDLIDAEEQMRLMRAYEYDTYDDYNRAFDMLDNAPTIIPSERSNENAL